MSAGQRIKKARQDGGFTQAELAEVLSVTPSAVSQWETDLTLPDVNKIVALSIVLKRSIDWLLRGVDTAFASGIPADPEDTAARVRRLEEWAWGGSVPSHIRSLEAYRTTRP